MTVVFNAHARRAAWAVLAARETAGDEAALAMLRAIAAPRAGDPDRTSIPVDDAEVKALASRIDLDGARFMARYVGGVKNPGRLATPDDPSLSPYDALLERDLENGRVASVRQVPMVFIDGRRVPASSTVSIDAIIASVPPPW